jgi:hypothetical protein
MYPRLTSSVQKLEIVKQFNSDWNILSAARGLVRCQLGDFANLVPRACDPWEGNEGSGIIRFREESDWPLK